MGRMAETKHLELKTFQGNLNEAKFQDFMPGPKSED
jgi:hypothetical protein